MRKQIGSKHLMAVGGGLLAVAVALTAREAQLAAGYALCGVLTFLALAVARAKGKPQLAAIVAFVVAGASAPTLFFTLFREQPFFAASLTYGGGAVALVASTRKLWTRAENRELGWLVWTQATAATLAAACAAYLWILAPLGGDFLARRLIFTVALVGVGLVLLVAGRRRAHGYLGAAGITYLGFGLCKACLYDATHLQGVLRIGVFAASGALLMLGGSTLRRVTEPRNA